MGKITSIQWAHSTLNLQSGCDGCELWNRTVKKCYAGKQIDGEGNRPGYKGLKGWPKSFDEPALFLGRMDEGERWGKPTQKEKDLKPWIPADYPRVIFLNDMGDTFSKKLPLDWLAPMLPRMAATPHQYLVLTKRPSRFVEFSKRFELPPNVWPGTTVTSKDTINRVLQLAQVQGGGPKFLSIEPMWSALDFDEIDGFEHIRWVIFGGESGAPEGRIDMNLRWLENGIDQCGSWGIPAFVKQMGAQCYFPLGAGFMSRAGSEMLFFSKTKGPSFILDVDAQKNFQLLADSHGGDWDEWPQHLRIREMPVLKTPSLL